MEKLKWYGRILKVEEKAKNPCIIIKYTESDNENKRLGPGHPLYGTIAFCQIPEDKTGIIKKGEEVEAVRKYEGNRIGEYLEIKIKTEKEEVLIKG